MNKKTNNLKNPNQMTFQGQVNVGVKYLWIASLINSHSWRNVEYTTRYKIPDIRHYQQWSYANQFLFETIEVV